MIEEIQNKIDQIRQIREDVALSESEQMSQIMKETSNRFEAIMAISQRTKDSLNNVLYGLDVIIKTCDELIALYRG